MRTDLRWQADQLGVTLRTDDTSLTRIINQSIQRFREWVSEQGWPLYLVAHSGMLNVGATAPYAFGTLDLSAWNPLPVHLYHLELTVNGHVLDVAPIPFEHRNQYQGFSGPIPSGATQAIPCGWFRFGATVGFVPPAQGAYAYTAWYMPQIADLVADGDTFDGIAGWEEWLTWDCFVKLISRDRDVEIYALATTERDRLQREFEQRLRQDRPSVTKRYDLRGMRNRRAVF